MESGRVMVVRSDIIRDLKGFFNVPENCIFNSQAVFQSSLKDSVIDAGPQPGTKVLKPLRVLLLLLFDSQ